MIPKEITPAPEMAKATGKARENASEQTDEYDDQADFDAV